MASAFKDELPVFINTESEPVQSTNAIKGKTLIVN